VAPARSNQAFFNTIHEAGRQSYIPCRRLFQQLINPAILVNRLPAVRAAFQVGHKRR
jgi:hypothetical protein